MAARPPSPLAGEAEERFSRESQPVPTRRLSPSPAPSPPLALIKLQVNLPGSGPAPGTKRLPADRDLPSLHLPSVPGTAWSPRCEHAAPRPPTALRAGSWSCSSGCGELGSALRLWGCCPLPEGTALCPCTRGARPGAAGTRRAAAEHPWHLRARVRVRFGARWAKPAARLGALKIPARIPAAAVLGWELRSEGARAWLGLCRAGRRGPVLGSIPRDGPNSTWHPALPASREFPPSSPSFGRVPTDPQHPGGFLRRAQAGKPHPASKCCRRNRRDAALQDSPATDKRGWDEPWAQGPSAPHNTPQGCTPQQHTPLRVHLQVQGQDTGSAPLCHPQWVWGTQPGTVLPSQLPTAPGYQGNPQHRSIPFHPPLEPISIPLPSSSAQKPP